VEYADYKEIMVSKISDDERALSWTWRMDWCKENNLHPEDQESWEKSLEAYRNKTEDRLNPTSCVPTSKPRPPLQYKEPIKIKEQEDIMSFNIGESNYSTKKIQPWHIWEEYNLNPWDADIVKRVLRTKKQPGKTLVKSRIEDYQKIIHDCQYRIKKLEESNTLDKKRR